MPQKVSVSILISNPITGYGIKYTVPRTIQEQFICTKQVKNILYTTTGNKKQYNIDIEI